LLGRRVTDDYRALAHRRLRRRTPAAVHSHQQAVGHATARADAHALVLDLVLSPVLNVAEAWRLKEMGFETGTALEVKVLPGCLILAAQEPQPEPPAEPEVVTTLRKACKKLSARKQREIAVFIELVATPQKRPRKIPEGTVEWRSA